MRELSLNQIERRIFLETCHENHGKNREERSGYIRVGFDPHDVSFCLLAEETGILILTRRFV
jgi:hypothetical protein